MDPGRRRHLVLLWLIIVLSTGMRVGWAAYASANHPETMVSPDTPSYVDSAAAWAETGEFRESIASAEPMFVRTPGYPAFLAVLRLLQLSSVRAVAMVQALLGAVLTLLVYRLARQLSAAPATAALAAFLCAFSPLVLWSSTSVLTEFTNSICLAAFATAFVDAIRHGSERAGVWYAGGAGVALAAATLVRPTTYYFPLLLVPVVVLLLRSRVPGKRVLLQLGVLLLPTVLLIGGWQMRNAQQVGSARYAGIEAMSMYWYRAAGVSAGQTGRPIKVERDRLIEEFGPRSPAERQGPYLDRMYSRGVDIVLDDPVPAVKNSIRGLFRSVFGINFVFTNSELPRSPLLVAPLALSIAALWLLAAIGTLSSWTRDRSRPVGVILFVLVTYVLVISAGPEAYSRFRAPIEPLLCVLGAGGLTWVTQALPRRR